MSANGGINRPVNVLRRLAVLVWLGAASLVAHGQTVYALDMRVPGQEADELHGCDT